MRCYGFAVMTSFGGYNQSDEGRELASVLRGEFFERKTGEKCRR